MLFAVVIPTYLLICSHGYPISKAKENRTSNDDVTSTDVRKRYFEGSERVYEAPKNVRGDERDFMAEVIDHALHHRKIKPDKWMDFYNNGAKWGHYISPQIHHPSLTNIHDPHFNARLSYTDGTDEETNRNAANQENHVEAYPGELVSGENSLSKFIAPPVFDEPEASSRDTISAKNKQKENNLLNTPEAAATENSNTRKLVDSLNSFMTPLKVPSDESNDENARTRENLEENKDWGTNDKQINNYIDSESKYAQGEASSPQYEPSIQDIFRHEPGSSRDGLERAEQPHSSRNAENNMRFEQEAVSARQRFDNSNEKNSEENFREENREENQSEFPGHARHTEFGSHSESNFPERERNENEAIGNENSEAMSSRANENPESFQSRGNAEMMASRNNEEYRERLNENEHFMRNNARPSIERFHEMGDMRENPDERMNSRFLPVQRHFSEDDDRHDNVENNERNEDSRYSNDYHSPDRSEMDSRASRYSVSEKPSAIEVVQDPSGRIKPAQLANEGAMTREFMPSRLRFAEDREEKMSMLHRQLGKLKKSTVS